LATECRHLTDVIHIHDRIAVHTLDRHRGGSHLPTPATPPCVRVRTRRFEKVTLTLVNQ
jgi:hypothetical protein